VSDAAPLRGSHERLLTFEVGGGVYALPIGGVLEVVEAGDVACIPTLPPALAGVVNHHGDVLPVLSRSRLLDVDGTLPEPEQVLVVSGSEEDSVRLGLPVDRVLGLADGAGAAARGAEPVADRRQIDGRLVSVLDPRRLVERAREVIESSTGRAE
jgi:chemotaxis signal transduction protein